MHSHTSAYGLNVPWVLARISGFCRVCRRIYHPTRGLASKLKYYALRSIVGSQKQPVPLKLVSDSFFQKAERVTPYIEPTFTKEEYPAERPAILLISAGGPQRLDACVSLLWVR